jgi:hypothetical protein
MKLLVRITCAAVPLAVLAALIWGTLVYFSWSARGDAVAFSPTGRLGWGTKPYYVHGIGKKGTRVGTIRCYLFIGDAHIETSSLDEAVAPSWSTHRASK